MSLSLDLRRAALHGEDSEDARFWITMRLRVINATLAFLQLGKLSAVNPGPFVCWKRNSCADDVVMLCSIVRAYCQNSCDIGVFCMCCNESLIAWRKLFPFEGVLGNRVIRMYYEPEHVTCDWLSACFVTPAVRISFTYCLYSRS